MSTTNIAYRHDLTIRPNYVDLLKWYYVIADSMTGLIVNECKVLGTANSTGAGVEV